MYFPSNVYITVNVKPIFHCEAKPCALGPRIDPHCHNFALGIPTFCYLKMLKFALPPRPTPNASRWNIGGVGSPTRGAGVGHVDFMLYVSISFALVSQRERSFQ